MIPQWYSHLKIAFYKNKVKVKYKASKEQSNRVSLITATRNRILNFLSACTFHQCQGYQLTLIWWGIEVKKTQIHTREDNSRFLKELRVKKCLTVTQDRKKVQLTSSPILSDINNWWI